MLAAVVLGVSCSELMVQPALLATSALLDTLAVETMVDVPSAAYRHFCFTHPNPEKSCARSQNVAWPKGLAAVSAAARPVFGKQSPRIGSRGEDSRSCNSYNR